MSKSFAFAVCLSTLLLLITVAEANQIYRWKTIQFKNLTRDLDAIVDGQNVYYKEANVMMTSAHYDVTTGYICSAFPRTKHSNPVTIGCFSVSDYSLLDSPKYSAFPSVADNDLPGWTAPTYPAVPAPSGADAEWVRKGVYKNSLPGPYNLVNVHKVHFDSCGRLWFIDVGTLEDQVNRTVFHKPTLWAFDVKLGSSGMLLSRPYLKYEIQNSNQFGLRNLVVDIHDKCDDYHVYMPNTADSAIVVYSSAKKINWQFKHASMAPVLKELSYTFQNVPLQFLAGIYSLSMTAKDSKGYRDVYYMVATGTGQFKVNSQVLRDRKAAGQAAVNSKAFAFVGYRGQGVGLSRVQVFDTRTNVLFSGSVEETAIKCWNQDTLLTPDNYGTVFNHSELFFGTDIKVDAKGNLWSLSNMFPLIRERGMDVNNINFSLFRVKPREVIRGTVCANAADPAGDDTDARFD